MAWTPISRTVPQYENSNGVPYSGAVLKAYRAGTSTVISIATDATGSTLVSSVPLNANGFPAASGNVVLPHINEKYKLALYPNQSAADSDTGAIWTIDNIAIGGELGSVTREITTSTALDSTDNNSVINASGTITITMPDIDVVGAGFIFMIHSGGVVTLDGNGSETINGAATAVLKEGASATVVSGESEWTALISYSNYVDADSVIGNAGTSRDVRQELPIRNIIGIGYPFAIWDHLTGVDAPDNSGDMKFVKLTAGQDGTDEYNDGLLINESLSGSAPLVEATAEIAVGPLAGETIHLLNTENRYLMPGESSGTTANDQMQQITGSSADMACFSATASGAFTKQAAGSSSVWASGAANHTRGLLFDSADSPNARTGDHTDVKHSEATYYMRIV